MNPTYKAFVPDSSSPSKSLGYLRLGAYESAEDGYVSHSIALGDGACLMTTADLTTSSTGDAYVYAWDNATVSADGNADLTIAGQTDLIAMTVGVGADSGTSTGNNNVNLDAKNGLTLEAEQGIDITCQRLVFVVDQNYKASTANTGQSHYETTTTFTIGGKSAVTLLYNTDISGLRWEPGVLDHKYVVYDLSSVVVKGTGQVSKNENQGKASFLIGLFLPIKAGEAEADGAANQDALASMSDNGVESGQTGAGNDTQTVTANTNGLSSH